MVIVFKANGRVALMNMDEIEVEEFTDICVELRQNAVVALLADIAQLRLALDFCIGSAEPEQPLGGFVRLHQPPMKGGGPQMLSR